MSKVIIDLNEFTHLKGESVYNYNFYKHNKYGYEILQDCQEEFETFDFYLDCKHSDTKSFLDSCRCDSCEDGCYQGDLGFYWS